VTRVSDRAPASAHPLGTVTAWRHFATEVHHHNAAAALMPGERSARGSRVAQLAADLVTSDYLEALVSCNPNALVDALGVLYQADVHGRLDAGTRARWVRHAARALEFCTELIAPEALLLKSYCAMLRLGDVDTDPAGELETLAVTNPLWAFRHHANAAQTEDYCKVVIAFAVAGWSVDRNAARWAELFPALRDALFAAAVRGNHQLDAMRLASLPPSLVGRSSFGKVLAAMPATSDAAAAPLLDSLRALAHHADHGYISC
jgi:hypothetical protein